MLFDKKEWAAPAGRLLGPVKGKLAKSVFPKNTTMYCSVQELNLEATVLRLPINALNL